MKWIYKYFRADHNWVPRGPFNTQEEALQHMEEHKQTTQCSGPIEVKDNWEPYECHD